MLIFNRKQYLEGIDGIDLMLRPYLYNFLDLHKQLDPNQRVSIFSTRAKIPQADGLFAYKSYYYLHISGEYINPELPIKESIGNAISMLIRKGILCITDKIYGLKFDEVSRELIVQNLSFFVTGISGIEFCFDFEEKNVRVTSDAEVINVSDWSFPQFLRKKLKERPRCLIKEETTFYSYDYNKRRKSTMKLYNRETWLLKKNNEYSKEFIKNNPYKIRIEFVFKRYYNSSYLTFNNIDGNYFQIIERFIPHLAKLYEKYFLGKILVDPYMHPYFSQIYTLAYIKNRERKCLLENITHERRTTMRNTDLQRYYKLMRILERDRQKREKILQELPDKYFAGLSEISNTHFYTPFSMENNKNVLIADEDFTVFNDGFIFPKMNIIKNDNENERT
jgi:hypothetical protein